MRGMMLAVAMMVAGCSSSSEGDGMCSQRSGDYLVTYSERGGTCGTLDPVATTIAAQPTTSTLRARGCDGEIAYTADNCGVTYQSDCQGTTLRQVVVGSSTWSADGTLGTASEEHALFDLAGREVCRSTYAVSVRRQ